MAHARLTHPTRGTLEFRQGQQDDSRSEAVVSIANELGVDRPSLVHTETRQGTREIRGRVTAPRRSEQSGASDWEQALANYADLLESHVDEFQGNGYTLEDDQLNTSKNVILESISWSRSPGQPYDLEYEAMMKLGRGTMQADPIDRRNPTVNESMPVPLRIDGVDLPGFRDYRKERNVGVNVNAVWDEGDGAENNDVMMETGVEERFTFEGTHVGTPQERATQHDTLDNLVATTDPVTLETRFPGYTLEGFVTQYGPTQETRFAGNMHQYRIEFTVGQRA